MLSIEKCKEILEKEGNKYTKEETEIIRKWLLELIQIQGNNIWNNYDEACSINGESVQ